MVCASLSKRCEKSHSVCGYFSQCLFFHRVVKLRLYCGEFCIFPVSAFSIFSVYFFILMFRSNLPLSVFPRDSSI